MNNNIKMSIIGAAVIALVGAGGIYYRANQLQEKRDYFQNKFDKTKASLPKAVSIEKTSESSLFSTDIKYIVQIVKEGKKSDSKLVINTHLNHGIGYLLSGVIKGTSVGKIEGPFVKEFKSMDVLFNSDIEVLTDDTLVTNTKFADLIAKDGTEFKGMSSFMKLTKDDDNLDTNFKIASLSSPKTPQGKSMFNLKGLELEYKGKSDKIANNHFGFKVAEIASPMAQISNINMVADSVAKSGSVDVTTSLSIAKINAAQWKNGSIDFKYSVLGLEEKALNNIYNLGQKTSPQNEEEIQKSIAVMEEEFKKIFTYGVSVNIDKLSFKSNSDSFDFVFKSSLPKSASFENVSFEKNLQLNYTLTTKGTFSNILAEEINKKLQSVKQSTENLDSLPEEQIIVENNQLKLTFEIDSGVAKLNGKHLPKEQQDIVQIVLSTLDERLQNKEESSATVPSEKTSEVTEINEED